MNPRERVLTALRHEEPDRVPTFFRAHLANERLNEEQAQYIHEVVDIGVGIDPYLKMKNPDWTSRGNPEIRYDELGIGRKYTGLYWDIVDPPLAALTSPAELADYPWPDDLRDESRISHLRPEAEGVISQERAVAVMGSWGGSTGFFEVSWYMRGFQKFLMDLHLNVPFAEALLDKQLELHLIRWEIILDHIGDLADIVCIGDDLGTQNSLLISPRTYRNIVKPRQKALIDSIKRRTDAKIYYHTDGAVMPLVPDLIEVGVDVLDPIQPASLDPGLLNHDYGDRLAFFGGIDLQHVLPHGSPAEVQEEVLTRFEQMGGGGGLVLGPSHWIQPDVPWENIHAMYEAIHLCKY